MHSYVNKNKNLKTREHRPMFVTKSQLLVLVSKNVSQTADLIIIIYLQFWTLKEGTFNYMRG